MAAAQHAGVVAAVGLDLDPGLITKSRDAALACGLDSTEVKFMEVNPGFDHHIIHELI